METVQRKSFSVKPHWTLKLAPSTKFGLKRPFWPKSVHAPLPNDNLGSLDPRIAKVSGLVGTAGPKSCPWGMYPPCNQIRLVRVLPETVLRIENTEFFFVF